MYEPFISDSPVSDLWGVQETVVVRWTILPSQLRCYGNWETMVMRFVYVRWWRGVYLRRKQLDAWYWIQRGSLCPACLSAFPVTWRSQPSCLAICYSHQRIDPMNQAVYKFSYTPKKIWLARYFKLPIHVTNHKKTS